MAALMQKSAFMGQTLHRTAQPQSTKAPRSTQVVQAFFKKAQKEVKKAAPKGGATQVVRKAQKGVQQAVNKAKKVEPKAAKQLKAKTPPKTSGTLKKAVNKVAPKKPSLPKISPPKFSPPKQVKKAVTQVKRAAPRPPPKAKAPVKQAQRQIKKVAKGSKGWLGGAGGPQSLDQWYGPSRALYLPRGLLDPQDIPSYLNGSQAGDYGYDPLSLGQDVQQVEKYREYELIHARWAMLAAAGIVIPEGLQANGADIKGGTWFETGAVYLNNDTLNYFAVPWAVINNPLPLVVLVAIEAGLIGAAETYRRSGEGPPGYSPGVGKFDESIFNGLDNLYPGGPFDPLGLADDPETFQELKVKEIKNGRLAMVSVLGFAVQGYVTGEGPYAAWSKHVSDPFGYNLLTVLGAEDRLPTL